ncbi:MAG: RHS repeat domain-containing protein [Thermodesulfobacteriota bacterium]
MGWDAAHRLSSVTMAGQTTRFWYDDRGRRVGTHLRKKIRALPPAPRDPLRLRGPFKADLSASPLKIVLDMPKPHQIRRAGVARCYWHENVRFLLIHPAQGEAHATARS